MRCYEWERGDPRRTKIIDDIDYTSPRGVKDEKMPEVEAQLWLLSKAERAAGGHVDYDFESERWVRGRGMAAVTIEKPCVVCGKKFTPVRASAIYDTVACRMKAMRRAK